MTREAHPDSIWYRNSYRQGWLAYVDGLPMPRAEHALQDAGLRDGWESAQRKYQADVIAGALEPYGEGTR